MTTEPTTRERIRQEAAALFREKGFNGTSMAELASEVGITKSSLYHHFPSKQALLSEIIELTVNRVTPLVHDVAHSDLPAGERLQSAVYIHTFEAMRDRDAVACFMEEGRSLAPDYMAAHIRNRDRYELLFRQIYEEGVAQGVFVDQDPGLAVKAILGMCNSVVRWYRPDGSRTADEIATEFARFTVRGAARHEDSPAEGLVHERSA